MTFRSLRPQSVHGRQAEARRNDLVVLEAARDVFTAQGPDAPISAVAERAGVGMGTLYRRYGSKTELLQRLCVLAMEQALAAAGDALAAGDPWDGLAGYIRACVDLRSGALAALAGQIETTAEMRDTARRGMARLEEIVARAHRAGRLRPDVTTLDISWLIEQFSRRSPDHLEPDEERNVRSRLVAIALDGLRTRPGHAPPGEVPPPAGPLPGRPPSRRHYIQRWSPLLRWQPRAHSAGKPRAHSAGNPARTPLATPRRAHAGNPRPYIPQPRARIPRGTSCRDPRIC